MASKIEWTEKVWEVTGGCAKCSSGCRECWAINNVWRMAHNPILGDKWQGLVEKKNGVLNWTGKIKLFDDMLGVPMKRNKPTTYFIDSKADLFHPNVPVSFIGDVHERIIDCPQHTFQILTKRIENAFNYYETCRHLIDMPFKNLHLGVSVCTQKEADEKIPVLLQIPAAVRFISIEPMLEGIDLAGTDKARMGKTGYLANYFTPYFCNNCGRHLSRPPTSVTWNCNYCAGYNVKKGNAIDWVIVGAESKGRGIGCPCKPEWVDSIVNQCKDAGVPCFVKQIHRNGKLVKMPKEYPQEYTK